MLGATQALASDTRAVVGSWDLTFEERGTTVRPKLTLTERDGALAGEWSGPRGTVELSDVKYEDGVLSFTLEEHAVFRDVDVQFSARVSDGKLTGTLRAPKGEAPVTGVRAAPK
jgi:hypothetical protein